MDNKNINYANGIEYAIRQIYEKDNKFDAAAKELEAKYGRDAKNEFSRGYFEALTYFTYAIDYYKTSEKTIEEKAEKIENSYGEEIKNIFLMGIEHYRKRDMLEESLQRKK